MWPDLLVATIELFFSEGVIEEYRCRVYFVCTRCRQNFWEFSLNPFSCSLYEEFDIYQLRNCGRIYVGWHDWVFFLKVQMKSIEVENIFCNTRCLHNFWEVRLTPFSCSLYEEFDIYQFKNCGRICVGWYNGVKKYLKEHIFFLCLGFTRYSILQKGWLWCKECRNCNLLIHVFKKLRTVV